MKQGCVIPGITEAEGLMGTDCAESVSSTAI